MRSGARCAGAKPDHQENSSDLIKLKVYLLHTTTLFNLASQPPFCCLCGISWIPHATKKGEAAHCGGLLLWTPFSRFHTAGRMISSDSSTCFASREDGCYNVVLPLREVVSMEKMEDTSLLPSPILISIRSKMVFQFIELKDRETLVETLLERLKQVHANHPVHYDTSTNDKDMAGHTSPVLYLTSRCSDHKFGDLEMVSCHSSKEREDKSPPLHPGHLTVVLQPLCSQNPDSHLVVEATPSLVCHGH
ncbi:TBC1 domain family member 8-like isoform X2 [Sciurus carolinensis]|uniref:TBC1 domain family member 8-like isoform X2 n=1 Tax=Sciurus carolinensis TaxID=30640 RepID=UPI001FB4CA79|nr:TBC1 domain family member 8-like isoform X2 [Sciurus carolinensis]